MNKLTRAAAAAMCALTAVSAMTFAPVTASAAGRLSYSFSGEEKDKAGYAEGTITLSGVPDGQYKLCWADDKCALEGFYELAQVEVSGGSASFTLGDHTAIPADAVKLIAVSGGDTAVSSAEAVYDIPESKRLKYKSSDANYTFMDYSDIHIDKAARPFYQFSDLHFEKALKAAVNRGADFIVTAGDNINNGEGPGEEFDRYREILADSDYANPIYEASGNHELRVGTPEEALSAFANATGLDGSSGDVTGKKPYYFVEEKKSGDIFIFMVLEYLFSPNEGDEFSDEQLKWFEGVLDEYYGKNRNIYLIEHALIDKYGAGDDKDSYYSVPLLPKHKSTRKFIKILEAHPDLIWISGHTHIALKYGYNYSDNNGQSCHMIHDSSVSCPTILNMNSHSLSYNAAKEEEYKDFSEGYWVQVFDDAIIFNGENLYYDKIYPSACYIMESCRSTFVRVPREEKPETAKIKPDYITNRDIATLAHQYLTLPKSVSDECKITSDDVAALRERAEKLLVTLYSYSSYDCYQALKKAVKSEYSDDAEEYAALSKAYLSFYPYTFEGEINIYFANTMGWKHPRVKLWSAKDSNGNGEKLIRSGTTENGTPLYTLRVNSRRYNQLQFTDGGDTEVSDIHGISGVDNKLYTINTMDREAPYYVFVEDYK